MRPAILLAFAVSVVAIYLWPPLTIRHADPMELFRQWHDVLLALLAILALALSTKCGSDQVVKAKLSNTAGSISTARNPLVDAEIAQLLSLFQERGRLVDFLMEDLTGRADAQVGGVARVVHQGCRGVLKEYFDVVPIHHGKEGEVITVPEPHDSILYRLLGKVPDIGPFQGKVLHRGWKTTSVTLPRVTKSEPGDRVIAPVDVEV